MCRAAWFVVAALAVATACGRPPGEGGLTASATRSASPTPAPTASASTPAGWQTYTDSQYGFSVAYPSTFTFKTEGPPNIAPGWLREFRAVDNAYLGRYPPGQVEIGVYVMDADSLQAWITKHTGPNGGRPGSPQYWMATPQLQATTAAGRPAFTFDESGQDTTLHSTVYQAGAEVIRVTWWATDPNYSATIEQVAEQMLASFQGPI